MANILRYHCRSLRSAYLLALLLVLITVTIVSAKSDLINRFCKNKADGHYCAKCRSKFFSCRNGDVINRHDCNALDCVQDTTGSRRAPYAECGTLNFCATRGTGHFCDGPYNKHCQNGKLLGYTFLPNSCFSDDAKQSSPATLSHEFSDSTSVQQESNPEEDQQVELLYSAENDVNLESADETIEEASLQTASLNTEPEFEPQNYARGLSAEKVIQGASASTLASEFFASVMPAVATNEPCKNKLDGAYCIANVTNSILNCVKGAGILSHCPALTSCNQTAASAAQCIHVSKAAHTFISGGMFIYYAVPIIGLVVFGLFTIGIFICSLAITLSGQ